MLKTKEKRDLALLVFMGVVTAAFLLYIFIPSGAPPPKKEDSPVVIEEEPAAVEKQPKKEPPPYVPPQVKEKKGQLFSQLNKIIQHELNRIYLSIMDSEHPFESIPVNTLKKTLSAFNNDTLNKFFRFGFNDLNEALKLPFPDECSGAFKFNVFLSLFVIKLQEEHIKNKIADLPKSEYEKNIRFDYFLLINNEIQKDYQIMPILFYFSVMMNRIDVYPPEDPLFSFMEKIKPIKDLSNSRQLTQLRELFQFSAPREGYRVNWVEHDGIGSDDKKEYTNLRLRTCTFLQQKYLVFPDTGNDANNLWLKDLLKSDSGNIELKALSFMNEEPSVKLRTRTILYPMVNSQFIVLLKDYRNGKCDKFLDSIVTKRFIQFNSNLTAVNFTGPLFEPKLLKQQLDTFGNYLKKKKVKMKK
ncbi:MAG: hypothetical protein GY757_20140 [bacterium]|nr:hypothetical protein [bacterium]